MEREEESKRMNTTEREETNRTKKDEGGRRRNGTAERDRPSLQLSCSVHKIRDFEIFPAVFALILFLNCRVARLG